MLLRIFQQFEPFSLNRLVREKGETPTPAVPEAGATPPPSPTAPPSPKAAAEGEKRKAAVTAGKPDEAAAEKLLAQYLEPPEKDQAREALEESNAPTYTPKQIIDFFKRAIDKFTNFEGLDKTIKSMTLDEIKKQIAIFESFTPEDRQLLVWISNQIDNVTDSEKEIFIRKYSDGAGKIDWKLLGQKFLNEELEPREYVIAIALATYLFYPSEKITEVYAKYKDKFQAMLKGFLQKPDDLVDLKEKLLNAITDENDKKVVSYMLRPRSITDDETNLFEQQYIKDGAFNADAMMEKVAKGELTLREFFTAFKLMHTEDIDRAAERKLLTPVEARNLTHVLRIIPRESPPEADVKKVIEKYKTAYETFLKDKNKAALLEAMKDDQESIRIMTWLLEEPVSDKEIAGVQDKFKKESKELPKTAEEIDAKVAAGELDYRQGRAIKESLHDMQQAAVAEGKTLEEAAAETGGFMALLEKLIDKLTALANRLSAEVDKFFKPKQEKASEQAKTFDNSPIKGGQFTIAKNPDKGFDLTTDEPREVAVVVDGAKVEKAEPTYVILAKGNAKFIYTGLTPSRSLTAGVTVKAGDTLGQMTGTTLNFQALNEKGEQVDPGNLFKPEWKKTEQAAATTQPAPAPAKPTDAPPSGTAATPPSAPPPPSGENGPPEGYTQANPRVPELKLEVPPLAHDMKLILADARSVASGEATFEVPSGATLQAMLPDSIISGWRIEDGKGILEVTSGDIVMTYSGLDPNSLLPTSSVILSVGAELAGVSTDGKLVVAMKTKDGRVLDPAVELAKYIS